MPERVAFFGLGNMGLPMAGRLAASGHHLIGFDLDRERSAQLQELGANVAQSPNDALRDSDVVVLMLPDSDAVQAVVGELSLESGQLIIDMSSSDPERTRDMASRLLDRGVYLVDAPVSGGVGGAREGRLTIMLGSPLVTVRRVTELLQPLGSVKRVGEVGAGHLVKALNNLLSATHLLATSEAVDVARRFGVDPAVFLETLNSSSGRSGSTEVKFPRFILPRTYDSGFALRLMTKDALLATSAADKLGSPLLLGHEAARLWRAAASSLAPEADHTQIDEWVSGGEIGVTAS